MPPFPPKCAVTSLRIITRNCKTVYSLNHTLNKHAPFLPFVWFYLVYYYIFILIPFVLLMSVPACFTTTVLQLTCFCKSHVSPLMFVMKSCFLSLYFPISSPLPLPSVSCLVFMPCLYAQLLTSSCWHQPIPKFTVPEVNTVN